MAPITSARVLIGLLALLAGPSAAAVAPLSPRDASSTPRYTPLADTASSCLWWWNSDDGLPCTVVLQVTGVSERNFIAWNPSITAGCGNYATNKSYCIRVDTSVSSTAAPPSSTRPPVSSTSETAPPPSTTTNPGNGIETPSPIQPGMVDNCDAFHFVERDQSCDIISRQYGITMAQFLIWNPEVGGASCRDIWAEVYVCVSVIGHTPTPPQPTTTTGNGIATPTPIQDGMVGNCDRFYLVKRDDLCASIAQSANIPLAKFYEWNPAVKTDCSGMWADTFVCTRTVGYTAPPPTTTTTRPGNGVATPTPIQTGMTTSCRTFHFVRVGEICQTIVSRYSITMANFVRWNPAVRSDCTGLWANTYACIAVL